MLFFWKRFFCQPAAKPLLGVLLKEARLQRGLSISDAARAAQLEESILLMLESDSFFYDKVKSDFRDSSYHRLLAVRYARSLGLMLEEIKKILPPLASLNPSGYTFLRNLSALSTKQDSFWKRQISVVQHRALILPSRKMVVNALFKFLIIVLIIVALLYVWNLVRYLNRVI